MTSPSPIIETFIRAVRREYPPEQQEKLKGHEEAVANTTEHEDGRRARHCALWAIRLSDDKHLGHPRWREIKELHQMWKDVWFGVEFGLFGATDKRQPIKDVEIEWTEDAVSVAKLVGEADGWDHAPWEDLFVDLLGMEPKGHRGF